MKRMCWDTRATDSIIKSGQKDTEANIQLVVPSQGRKSKNSNANDFLSSCFTFQSELFQNLYSKL